MADANGRAAAIAAYASANPSPWADLAAAQAAAEAALKAAQANARLARANAAADAQETAEQAESDAETAQDDADAQAEHGQSIAEAASEHDAQAAAAQAADAVFENLPDTLIAPADGPTPVLTGDFWLLYEAGDLVADPTTIPGRAGGSGAAAPWHDYGAPNFMPERLGDDVFAYDWTGYGGGIPFGLLGTYSTSGDSGQTLD